MRSAARSGSVNAGAILRLARSRARTIISGTGARRRHPGASGLPADALRMTSVKSTHVMPESSSNSRSRPASATGTCIPAGPRPPRAIAGILRSSSTKQRDSAVLQHRQGEETGRDRRDERHPHCSFLMCFRNRFPNSSHFLPPFRALRPRGRRAHQCGTRGG